MDKEGRWSLAPAFDLTYSFNPVGTWTASHQMTMNGRRDGFALDDFRVCARTASMKRGRAEAIVDEVSKTVARWPCYADEAGVPAGWRDQIRKNFRIITNIRGI